MLWSFLLRTLTQLRLGKLSLAMFSGNWVRGRQASLSALLVHIWREAYDSNDLIGE